MKALTTEYGAFLGFFEDRVTIQRIHTWVLSKINDKDNPFNLCEPHSCIAYIGSGNTINIYGDEDSKSFNIIHIIPDLI